MSALSNKAVAEPSLRDLLDLFQLQIFMQLKCHDLGTIQSFDPATQTAQVSINYRRSFVSKDPMVPVQYVDYPVLVDVPVFILSGGACSITFPIAKGDTCMVAYNDRDIDNWFQSGQIGPVASQRMHSFTDGMALVGFRSKQNALASYDTTRLILQNGTTFVGISDSKIKIANAATTLLTAMTQLTTALTTFTTATSTAAVEPTLGPASSALATSVATFKTTLQGLLE